MTKLLAPYSLCPLIERKKFLGVTDDSVSGNVIVTLDKNIAIRYRLSDQKQVSSWSTKRKMTAPVVYDPSSNLYFGVFNYEEVSCWDDTCHSLDKLKSIKFNWLIHSILTSKECASVVLYQNGIVASLRFEILNPSKVPSEVDLTCQLPTDEEIQSAALVTVDSEHYVALSTVSKNVKTVHFIPVDSDRGSRSSVVLRRDNAVLSSHVIATIDTPQLITLWSDGEMYSCPINSLDNFPGRLVSTISCIDCAKPSVSLPLSHHLALYGADTDSPLARLVVLSLKFGVPESSRVYRTYDSECGLWAGSEADFILATESHLVVVPIRPNNAKLVSLLGVEINRNEGNEEKNETVDEAAKRLKKEGKAEKTICEELFPKLISSNNFDDIKKLLHKSHDVPDSFLIQIARLSLDFDQTILLKSVLNRSLVHDADAIASCRSQFDLNSSSKILDVIEDLLRTSNFSKSLVEWACLLVDSFYSQYLLCHDETALNQLKRIQEIADQNLDAMDQLVAFNTELEFIKKGKILNKKSSFSSLSYIIEKIKLY